MKNILYYRVSTQEHGRSGLGLEAQRHTVENYGAYRGCEVLAEYQEIESGKRDDRPELAKALHHAKATGATLVIAKLDRLSRNVAFLATLQDSNVKFIAADNPDANELTIHIMAAMAQAERKAISTRTREALQAAKRRGQKLGNPNGAEALRRAGRGNVAAIERVCEMADHHAEMLRPVIERLQGQGITTLAPIARALNDAQMRTPRGGSWHPTSVKNLLERLGRRYRGRGGPGGGGGWSQGQQIIF